MLDKQLEQLRQKEKTLEEQGKEVERRLQNVDLKDKQLSTVIAQQKNQLLKMTAMSIEDAKEMLLKRMEDECELEMSALIQRKVEEAKEKAADKSRDIISTAIQRYVAEQTCEVTVSAVEIPNDDMKGRIIGREGRNIRAFEKATGVDVIVDDTPGVIVVSAFDPVRREVARLSLERLITDGRIHPGRIEEIVAKVGQEMEQTIRESGERATFDVGVHGINPELIKMIGKLKFRTSFAQNVLQHSLEVAFLAGAMASETTLMT